MAEESPRRLSQIFDPLARLSELAPLSHSTPSSPRLLPRRVRGPPPPHASQIPQLSSLPNVPSFTNPIPPIPPPRPQPHAVLDALDAELPWRSEVAGVNWQERCLELQLELHRSRNQATRVRDMLRDKVGQFFVATVLS